MRSLAGAIAIVMFATGYAQFGDSPPFHNPQGTKGLTQKPEFYTMQWRPGTHLVEKRAPISIEVDSMGPQEVHILVDSHGKPLLYASDISTPVCADGDCRLMDIRLYWTLLGEYAGFDRYRNAPLTKHDHDEFLAVDYLKLHQLLMDDNSILKRRKIDELVEKPKQPQMEGVDAVSGATIKEVKESVVGGALYSCYTAWHLVHGTVKDEIKKHTLSLLDDSMVLQMLLSNEADYQLFALKRMDEQQYAENYRRIAEIVDTGIPLVRSFIIKNLPDSFWNSDELQAPFWENFSKIDINSRSLLLDHLEKAPDYVIINLSEQLTAMTKNQLNVYLGYLSGLEKIDSQIITNLKEFSNSNTETNAYLVTSFLEDYKL